MILSTSKTRIRHHQPGFTLVELLIVIIVIAILAAITVVAYNGVQDRAKATVKVNDIKVMQKLIEMYNAENGSYPSTGMTWRYQRTSGNDFIPGIVPKYTNSLPQITDGSTASGTNNTYIYISNGTNYKLARLHQPSLPPGEVANIPNSMHNGGDRWGVWSDGGAGF